MPSYNPYGGSQDQLNNTVMNRGFFSKMLRNMSNFGLDFTKVSAQNSYSITMYEDPSTPASSDPQNMYDIFTKKVIANILNRKSIAYLDRSYEDKRKILRQYCMKDEIKDFLTIIADETVIYDDDNYFCRIQDLPTDMDETVRKKYIENFHQIYSGFGFDDGVTGWNYIKNLLIDGYICYEIVYDNKNKNVEKLMPIDPMTIIPATDPGTQTVVWVQYPNDPQRRRVMLDAQIVYISWSNNNEYSETSYVENLIRPYNQLKLIEQTRLLYNINQAAIYKKFIIPTNGLSRQMAEQQIVQLMTEYHEDVQWDDRMGTVSINGSNDVPHSKDFWFPSGDGGQPDFEIVPASGTDLNEDTMLKWFFNKLKKASRIPFSRFEEEGGGGNFATDNAELTREEVKFGNFLKRIQTIFREIIVKPLKIQMTLDFPELKDDFYFHSHVKLKFNANDYFEEWKYLNNLAKRSEIASTLTSNLSVGDTPFIPIEWIARHIMKFSDEQLEEMARYRINANLPTPGPGSGGTGGIAPASGEGAQGQAQGGDFDMGEGGGDMGGQVQGGGQAQGGGDEIDF